MLNFRSTISTCPAIYTLVQTAHFLYITSLIAEVPCDASVASVALYCHSCLHKWCVAIQNICMNHCKT